MVRWMVMVCALGVVGTAGAAPMTLTWQGRALDAQGSPIEGAVELEVSLYESAGDEVADWSDAFDTTAAGGFFSVELGSGLALPSDLFAGGEVWVEVAMNDVPLTARQKLASVPFSMVSAGMSVQTQTPVDRSCDVQGAMVYDTAAHGMRVCDGTAWSWVSGTVCDAGAVGNTRYDGGDLVVCDGTDWVDPNPRSGELVFSNFEYDTTNRSFGGSWAVGRTWTQHAIPADTVLSVQAHIPQRNDATGWGGCYTEFQVNVDGAGWISLGDSGYEAMDNSGAAIQSSHFSFLYDPQKSSDYTVQFRQRHRSYSGTCWINENHGISSVGVGVGYTNLMLMAFKK